MVEPILMYNCEVSLAYIPKSWTYSKFENNMWNVECDVNKVTLSFLRQLLGVHKKTSSLALLGETGKYPLSVKIFQLIVKYWFRMTYSENTFLQACKPVKKSRPQSIHQAELHHSKLILGIHRRFQLSKHPSALRRPQGKQNAPAWRQEQKQQKST